MEQSLISLLDRWGTFFHSKNKLLMAVVFITVATFFSGIWGDFISDDIALIVTNPNLKDWSFGNLHYIFTHDIYDGWGPRDGPQKIHSLYYRPVFQVFIMATFQLAGLNVIAWHVVNIVLHVLAVIVVFLLVQETFQLFNFQPQECLYWSGFATMVFAIHPAQCESVSWIIGINTVLGNLLFLVAFFAFARSEKKISGNWYWYIGALVMFFLGVLTKESVLILPAVLGGYLWWGWRRTEPRLLRFRQMILKLTPFAVIGGVYWCVRLSIFGSMSFSNPEIQSLMVDNNSENLTLTIRSIVQTWPALLAGYEKFIVWPYQIPPYVDIGYVTSINLMNFWAPLLVVVGSISMAIWAARTCEPIRLALLWCVLPLLPVLEIRFFPIDQVMQSRHLYLPLIGWGMLVAVGGNSLWRRFPNLVQLMSVGIASVGLGLIVLTNLQIRVYQDNLTFYSSAVAWSPMARTPYHNLGGVYESMARNLPDTPPNQQVRVQFFQLAVTHYKKAIELSPRMLDPLTRLAFLEWEQGHLPEATLWFERIAQIRSTHGGAQANLGFVYQVQGRRDEAIEAFHRALTLDPTNSLAVQWRQQLTSLQASPPVPIENIKK